MTTLEMRYRRGDASADEIAAVVAGILAGADDPGGALAADAKAAGIDPNVLAGSSVEVREGAQGIEPALTTIIVQVTAQTSQMIAETLWTKVIWPRLRRRLGSRALLEREDDPEEELGEKPEEEPRQ